MGGVSGLETFGADLGPGEGDEDRLRRLKGFSLLSMKPWTETYGSILEQDPARSERERKEPLRRRGEGQVDRSSKEEEAMAGIDWRGGGPGWGNAVEAGRADFINPPGNRIFGRAEHSFHIPPPSRSRSPPTKLNLDLFFLQIASPTQHLTFPLSPSHLFPSLD